MVELETVSYLSAFFAGFFMFLAPCTLPLIPAYLGFISGVTEKEIGDKSAGKNARRQVLFNSALFALGFSLVLVLSGVLAGYIGSMVPHEVKNIFTIFGGLLIILFGLFMLGAFKSNFLSKERRVGVPSWLSVGTPVSSFLLGVAFATGWTPCFGPIYGLILFYASDSGTVMTGASLLGVFALGFSVPLMLFALLISQASRMVERALPYLHIVSKIGGSILIIIGLSYILGNTGLTNWFFQLFDVLDFEDVLLHYL